MTKDAFLHVPLFAAFSFLVGATFMFVPLIAASVIVGCIFGFLREVIQLQAKTDSSFLKCWDFWNWSSSKLIETFAPMMVLLTFCLVYYGGGLV